MLWVVSFSGHWWTLLPHLAGRMPLASSIGAEPFRHAVIDERLGRVRLSGQLTVVDSSPLVLLVHGLGGSDESGYIRRMARASYRAGWSSLRLCLRGADLQGQDFYHAGLCSDLVSVLSSEALARFDDIVVVGFSLGGHVSLKLASAGPPQRVRAIASVSAPLDLAESARFFDERVAAVYRRHVLANLKAMLVRGGGNRAVPMRLREIAKIERIQDWDERIVAPRYGFESARHYYQSVSAHTAMAAIRVPTLLVHARQDPMVNMAAVTPGLETRSACVEAVVVERGGHVGFPGDLDLGLPGSLGLENQILCWLSTHLTADVRWRPAVASS